MKHGDETMKDWDLTMKHIGIDPSGPFWGEHA